MKKLLLIGILVLGLVACGITPPAESSHEQEDSVMTFYYQNPDLEKLLDELTRFDEDPELSPNILPPLLGFLAGLSISQPEHFEIVTQNMEWKQNMRPIMESVPKVAEDLREDVSTDKMPFTAKGPDGLDFMWGAFSATGDPKFAEVVYRTMLDPKIDPLTRAAAQWSFTSQREQHPVLDEWFSAREKEFAAANASVSSEENSTTSDHQNKKAAK